MTPNPNIRIAMNMHHQQDDTSGIVTLIVRSLAGALVVLLIAAAALVLTGCSFTRSVDGSTTATLDAAGALRAIEIIAEK